VQEKSFFSIHLHGLDTVLHLLQVGQIGLQQKLHLLRVRVQFTAYSSIAYGVLAQVAAQLIAYWLKQQHSLWSIGSSSSTAYGVLAQVAAQLMEYWLKQQHSLWRICSSSSTAYGILTQAAAQLMAYWLK
jgi:hypothetical protein